MNYQPQPLTQRYFYCPLCGGALKYQQYDERLRLTCQQCGYIPYENPIVGVAAIVFNEAGELLLGRRKGGKYHGLWCIPCGYLEYDEDVYEGTKREFREETNLTIEIIRVFTVQSNFHDPERHTVGIWFLAKVIKGTPRAGDDLDLVEYFPLDKIPELAFPTDHVVIEMLRRERSASGESNLHPDRIPTTT